MRSFTQNFHLALMSFLAITVILELEQLPASQIEGMTMRNR
jgi:hypothetical protein